MKYWIEIYWNIYIRITYALFRQSLAALDAATLISEAVNAGATVAAFDGNVNADRNRVQVTAEELLLWRQQLAAIRIQHAYR